LALLTTQNISRAGVTPAYTSVAASDTFVPDAQTFIHVKAAGSTDSCVIQVLAGDPAGLTISDVTVSVTGGQERMIGPFPPYFFADPTTGLATVTHTVTASNTSGVFKLSQP
jgi:FlaG/FlaF family flagellin (archaellin)